MAGGGMRVCVIGAGAAGLVSARLLAALPDHFSPVVFEQSSSLGGTWVYTDRTGTDQHGLTVHSSMYRSLRTNLPKEVMGFPDFPFAPESCGGRSFISHEEVLDYLCKYATHFRLNKYIQFGRRVDRVRPRIPGSRLTGWLVDTSDSATGSTQQHEFDAVLVCNGHYSEPYIPDIPGLELFEGDVLHSHDYRDPTPYHDKTVILLGGRASGTDISIEVARVAKQVYLSHNHPPSLSALPANLQQVPGIQRLLPDSAQLTDSRTLSVDALILCTGYKYGFPFLSDECGVSVVDNVITPLYRHIIHCRYPRMGFIGVPAIVLPFPLFHKQVEYYLATLRGAVSLPDQPTIDSETSEAREIRHQMSLPSRYTHVLGPLQWAYLQQLTAAVPGAKSLDDAVQDLYQEVHVQRSTDLMRYRDRVYRITDPETFVEITDGVDATSNKESKL